MNAHALGFLMFNQLGRYVARCPYAAGSDLAAEWWRGYQDARRGRYESPKVQEVEGWKPYKEPKK